MDTPEKTKIVTPLSKFEESPVFNYINNLSPIKPVKSLHINQTFNSLSFASLPSVFTSPHVSSHKESRFFIRHANPDPSKTEVSVSSEDASQVRKNDDDDVVDAGQQPETASTESPGVHFAIELPQTLKYDCGSPESNDDATPVDTENGTSDGDGLISRTVCHVQTENEATGCDWDSLISDGSDLLIFSSPNCSEAFKGLIQKSLEPCVSLMSRNDLDAVRKLQTLDGDHNSGEPSHAMMELDPAREIAGSNGSSKCVDNNNKPNDEVNNELGGCAPFSCEPFSNLQRGMRRRCLDFETLAAARRKSLGEGSNSGSFKTGGESSRCIIPGIGLHLNALTKAALKDGANVNPESFPSGRRVQLSLSASAANNDSLATDQESVHESLALAITGIDIAPITTDDGAQAVEDSSQASEYVVGDDFNQNSPRKKRRRFENAGENEPSCKRCNCKKSKCLKLYCECFAAGVYCIEPCSCQDCFNKPIHEDMVLATRQQIESRNPLAFAPKVINAVPDQDESNKTPASARHKRGCNCKKSSCLKKYCECFQGGVGCSVNCRCEGCKNTFGRKDGLSLTAMEMELEAVETLDKSAKVKTSQKPEILITDDQNPSSALPATPLQTYSPLVQQPFSSKSKPPRSLLSIGSSSGLYTNNQKYVKPSILRSQPNVDKTSQEDDELPDILLDVSSPSAGIKTGSPNSKRVSPPHCELGSTTPGRKSGRKLILQSIPSFPSLTPQH